MIKFLMEWKKSLEINETKWNNYDNGVILFGGISIYSGIKFLHLSFLKSPPSKPSTPFIEQNLSIQQLKPLAESYNKRIYEEIKNSQ